MLSVGTQKKLLTMAYLNKDEAVKAIINNNDIDDYDIRDCIQVIIYNDFNSYRTLDTIVRDHIMETLCTIFKEVIDG